MTNAQALIEKFAQEHNVDAKSVAGMVEYLARAADKNPEIRAAMLSDDVAVREAVVTVGVKRWHEESMAFYQELLDNKTPRAQQYREQIYAELKASTQA